MLQPRDCRSFSAWLTHSSGINGSKHGHMRELNTQHTGLSFRTLYGFEPMRLAVLLMGDDKTGDNCLYDEHLKQLRKEGLIGG